MSNSRLVYSSSDGDLRKAAGEKNAPAEREGPQLPRDGIVRIFREKGGRGGKIVTVVRGLPPAQLQATASELKRLVGSGGAVKADAIEIQGDHREKVAARLETLGHRVKLAGG